jgi:hypothetical protein
MEMVSWLRDDGKRRDPERARAADRMDHCADYLLFRHYLAHDAVRLHAANFCKQHLICPVCAVRRGSKAVGAYLQRFDAIQLVQPTGQPLTPWMLTYTVKNGRNLCERMAHLRSSLKRLTDSRRKFRAGGRNPSTWGNMAGAVGAIEVTNKGNGWHPHVHIFGLFEGPYEVREMSREWSRITGDSFVCEAHEVYGDPAAAFAEVFKYALKFSEMSHRHNWQAAQVLKAQRLIFSLGVFRGVEIPETLTDGELSGPWVEYFFQYMGGGSYALGNPGKARQ